ncbi:hypothetical protein C8R44DRAFT_878965 [Mycena epipterygia]|nr:hypothetical protein C8R44DRAFT_878965 [Mycena epipterygia]
MGRREHLAPELVDHIIGFLSNYGDIDDLLACSLVSRSWVYPAQSHIFREINCMSMLGSLDKHRWTRFQQTTKNSPHVIRHVRQLHVYASSLHTETFGVICTFPFTHLQRTSIYTSRLTPSDAIALQHLLGLPTLRRVLLHCDFAEPFLCIWDRCSSGPKDIELRGCNNSLQQSPIHLCPSSVRVESLQCRTAHFDDWLMHTLCPFEFSGLRFLSMVTRKDILRSPNFLPAHGTIEALEFVIDATTQADLSSLSQLASLRMSAPFGPGSAALATLSTIAWSNSIHTLTLACSFHDVDAEYLDSQLSNLPIPDSATVEFEMSITEYASMMRKLPQFTSQKTTITDTGCGTLSASYERPTTLELRTAYHDAARVFEILII